VELQETVAVPEFVTLVGVITLQFKLAGTVSVNATVPVKPFTAVTVIAEVAESPALTAAGEVVETAKSVMVKVALVE